MPSLELSVPDHYRLFVAVLIPEQIKNELAAAQAKLQVKLPKSSVTWTKPEQLHVTLKFIGNVASEKLDALKQQLANALGDCAPCELQLERLGAFPDARFPRVIWAGVNDIQGTLARIHTFVEGAMSQYAPKGGHETFHAHATLGRVKQLKAHDKKIFCELLSKMSSDIFAKWQVNEIELMRSELSSQGALHTCVASFHLISKPEAV